MVISQCNICNKLFKSNNQDEEVCPQCKTSNKKTLVSLSRCLIKEPDINLTNLQLKTGIDRQKIIKLIRKRKIKVKNSVKCKRCGKNIDTGRFCHRCRQELITGLSPTNNNEKWV